MHYIMNKNIKQDTSDNFYIFTIKLTNTLFFLLISTKREMRKWSMVLINI